MPRSAEYNAARRQRYATDEAYRQAALSNVARWLDRNRAAVNEKRRARYRNDEAFRLARLAEGGRRYARKLTSTSKPGRPTAARKYREMAVRLLAERDGWVCGICGQPTNIGNATVDHIVPQFLGGFHAPDNLRLAHSRCNMSRRRVSAPDPVP